MATLTVTPSIADPGTTVSVVGAGFARKKTRLYLDGVLTNSIMPRKDGTFAVGVLVSSIPKDQTLVAKQYSVTWLTIYTVTILVKTTSTAPTPPAAPSNLKAVPGDKQVALSWGV